MGFIVTLFTTDDPIDSGHPASPLYVTAVVVRKEAFQ
jgi:hypothetical protein